MVSGSFGGPESGWATAVVCHMLGTKFGEWVCGSPYKGVGGHDSAHVCQGTGHYSPQRQSLLAVHWLLSRECWHRGDNLISLQETEQKSSLSREKLDSQLSTHGGI